MTPEILRSITRFQIAGVAVVSLATLALWPAGALGVLAGGLVMTANFWFMRAMLGRALVGVAGGPRILYSLLMLPKLGLVLALLWLLVVELKLDPAAIAIGLATLFVGITGGLWHHRADIASARNLKQTR